MLFVDNHPHEGFRFADIILPIQLPQLLTYGLPGEMQHTLRPGMRVEVALGSNRQYAGVVARLHNNKPETYSIKPVKAVLDEEPIVDERQMRFWQWISDYYIAAPGDVMQAALPAHLKLMGETTLVWNGDDAQFEWSDEAFLAAEALEIKKEVTISELRAIVGQRHLNTVLNELLEKQAVLINDSLEPLYRPKKERIVRLAEAYKDEVALNGLFQKLESAPRQLDVLMAYVELSLKSGFVRQADLLDRSSASSAQVKALADKGIFLIEEKQVDRLLYESTDEIKEVTLTPAQQAAATALESGLQHKNVALLEGVTGSGKTLLYVQQIRACIASGRQALLLLPEIGLTTQLVSRLHAYFGADLGVYHSRFSNNERVEIWEKVKKQQYKVVVGPRSALWLPFQRLGMIIVDEEHDTSYKQKEPAPRFHARDAAIYLASLHEAKVILGSATPSIESQFNAQQNKYAYVVLSERYQGVKLPAIEIVDASSLERSRKQGIRLLTPELQKAMAETLQQRKQVILFQNRRGYTPFQICTVCGWVPHCKNCAVSLTYHKSSDKLHCHYCGLKSSVIHTCPQCGSNRLRSKSFGTERIEEEVRQLFPQASVARMDVDSMRGKKSMNDLLDKLSRQKIDILVGTQMVVKGLDFATVALVGILSADSLLSYPDFRVNERAFQLMEQVSGRAGRTDGAGRVLIQAYNLQHPVLQWVKDHDVQACYQHEIKYRGTFAYPPFSRLIRAVFRHRDEPKAIEAALQMATALQSVGEIVVQGPAPAMVSKVRNQYIQEVSIKCPRDRHSLDRIKKLLLSHREQILARRGFSTLQIYFDVDPV